MIKTAVSFYENKNAYNVALSGDNLIENSLNKIDIKWVLCLRYSV